MAAHYRSRNIHNAFLLGDAAHCFPSTGGLGINTGFGDVHNLIWKLHAVESGQCDDTFLDTYEIEEIGLRMAVGATAQDILSQFLTEAVLLCMAGGIAGILLGVGSSWLITATLGWPTVSSPITIVVAFIVAAGVGIVFGFYPAWKASSLDPIDALRYE